MAIQVTRGVATCIRRTPENIVIQVQHVSDSRRAARALGKAAQEIAALDGGFQSAPGLSPGDRNGPKHVSGVLPTGNGPFVRIDGGHTPVEVLQTIPQIIAQRLQEEGIEDALLASPALGALWGNSLESESRAVVLRMYPLPPRRRGERSEIARECVLDAAEWVTAGIEPFDEVWADIESMQFAIPAAEAQTFFEEAQITHCASSHLLAGRLGHRIRGAHGCFWAVRTSIALAGGGPGCTNGDLVAIFEDLKAVARRMAPMVAYAFISIEPNFAYFANIIHPSDWSASGGTEPSDLPFVCDEIVADAFPYQVIGPGHLARLGRLPPGSTALADGRAELAIGEPSQWLLSDSEPFYLSNHPERLPVLQSGRQLLQACLLTRGETAEVRRGRDVRGFGTQAS